MIQWFTHGISQDNSSIRWERSVSCTGRWSFTTWRDSSSHIFSVMMIDVDQLTNVLQRIAANNPPPTQKMNVNRDRQRQYWNHCILYRVLFSLGLINWIYNVKYWERTVTQTDSTQTSNPLLCLWMIEFGYATDGIMFYLPSIALQYIVSKPLDRYK